MTKSTRTGGVVGLIGVGNLGSAMARRLLKQGRSVHLYTRRPETVAELASAGATLQASAVDIGRTCDVVLVVVREEAQVDEVVLSSGLLAAMASGNALIVHSTVRPEVTRAIAQAAEDQGVDVLDAPISGGPAGAEAGTLNIMVGGDQAAFNQHRWVLDDLGALVQLVGPIGAGSMLKLINNAAYMTQLRIAIAAIELASEFSIDRAAAGAALAAGSGESFALRRVIGSENFNLWLSGMPSAAHVVELLEKDARLLQLECDGRDAPLATMAGAAIRDLRATIQ